MWYTLYFEVCIFEKYMNMLYWMDLGIIFLQRIILQFVMCNPSSDTRNIFLLMVRECSLILERDGSGNWWILLVPRIPYSDIQPIKNHFSTQLASHCCILPRISIFKWTLTIHSTEGVKFATPTGDQWILLIVQCPHVFCP